jgi:hypothetical protein
MQHLSDRNRRIHAEHLLSSSGQNKKAGHAEGFSFGSSAIFLTRPAAFLALLAKGPALSGIDDFAL